MTVLRRPLKPHQIQSSDDRVRALAERAQRPLTAAIADALTDFRDALPRDEVARAIAGRRYGEIGRLLPVDALRTGMRQAFDRVATVYESGARIGVADLKAAGDAVGVSLGVHFDMLDPGVTERLQAWRTDLIGRMTEGAADTARHVATAGGRAGLSVDEISRDVYDTLGLAPRQAQAVLNFRSLLEQGDRSALTRELRDRRHDDTVHALADGENVAAGKIDDMVARYAENYLDHRAETIARTESLRAASEGLQETYSQAIESGAVPDSAVRREWLTAQDELVCPICSSIPDANAEGVSVDGPFESEDGPIDNPPVHANCRCTVAYITSPAALAGNI